MARQRVVPYYDFRKKINNPSHLMQLENLSEKWEMTISEICWMFIREGLLKEKEKREEINEIKTFK